jgi:hypothetical protein
MLIGWKPKRNHKSHRLEVSILVNSHESSEAAVAEALADDLEAGAVGQTGRERFTNHAEYLSSKNEPMPPPVPVDAFLPLPQLHQAVLEGIGTECHIVPSGASGSCFSALTCWFTQMAASCLRRGPIPHPLRRGPHARRGMMHPMQLRSFVIVRRGRGASRAGGP